MVNENEVAVLTFACIAEAVAHYHALGYKTVLDRPNGRDDMRIMRHRDGTTVAIQKTGFLHVEVGVSHFWEEKLNDYLSDMVGEL